MKVLYDARLLHSGSSGVKDIGVGLAEGLRAMDTAGEIELVLAGTETIRDSQTYLLPSRGFMHLHLPRAAERMNADLILLPRQTRPVISKVPTRSVVHDIGFIARPDLYAAGLGIRLTTRLLMGDNSLLSVSQFTADELKAHGYRGDVTVLPIGAQKAISATVNSANPYVLCVGVQSQHKNLARLVAAWERASTEGYRLVVCAKSGNDRGQFAEAAANSSKSDSIDVVGGLSAAEYDELLRGPSAYIQPSLYEGLCVPALNMMASGVPTIVADAGNLGTLVRTSPLRQIFDPVDVDDMARAISKVLAEPTYRAAIGDWGRAAVGVTDWAAVARTAVGLQ